MIPCVYCVIGSYSVLRTEASYVGVDIVWAANLPRLLFNLLRTSYLGFDFPPVTE